MKLLLPKLLVSLGDVDANVRKIRDFSTRAKEGGAELIVFPEMADTGYAMPVIQAQATPWTEGAVPELQRMAKELSLTVICGVSERDRRDDLQFAGLHRCERAIVASYRKTHLFTGTPIGEDKCFSPGRELKSFAFGDLRLGLSICYDLRFPEVYRTLAIEQGANVFILSSAWPFPRLEHFRTLAAARAIENRTT